MELTDDYCNDQYDNRSRVPGFTRYFDEWRVASAEARTRLDKRLDLAYGSAPSETLDLYPAAASGAPLMVFIHGGYWRSLDKADFAYVAPIFVEHGISVAVVNYALAPAVGIDTICLQVVRALAWLYRNAGAQGFDRDRIYVSGHSAGGHLTAMAMAARYPDLGADLPANLVKGGVAISGLYDLEPIRRASFLNVDLKLDPASAARMSPAYMPPATDAPLITAVGALESNEFLRQNALLGERWKKVLRADFVMPGRHHFDIVGEMLDPASPLGQATLAMCKGG